MRKFCSVSDVGSGKSKKRHLGVTCFFKNKKTPRRVMRKEYTTCEKNRDKSSYVYVDFDFGHTNFDHIK